MLVGVLLLVLPYVGPCAIATSVSGQTPIIEVRVTTAPSAVIRTIQVVTP